MNGFDRKLVLYTFGMFIKPSENPANDGFHRRNDPILEAVEKADGFLARSDYEGVQAVELGRTGLSAVL